MAVLVGQYNHQVDEKGRIRVPSRLRDAIGSTPYLMLGPDGCLLLYSVEEGEKYFARVFEDMLPGGELAEELRKISVNSKQLEADNQGRFLLDAEIVEKAHIKKNIVTVGAYNHLEIWAEEEWQKRNESNTMTLQESYRNVANSSKKC